MALAADLACQLLNKAVLLVLGGVAQLHDVGPLLELEVASGRLHAPTDQGNGRRAGQHRKDERAYEAEGHVHQHVPVVVVQKLHSLFNQAEAKGDAAVLTCGAWSGIHPAFIGVPLSCDLRVPVFLAYPRNPRPEVQRFVRAVRSLVR